MFRKCKSCTSVTDRLSEGILSPYVRGTHAPLQRHTEASTRSQTHTHTDLHTNILCQINSVSFQRLSTYSQASFVSLHVNKVSRPSPPPPPPSKHSILYLCTPGTDIHNQPRVLAHIHMYLQLLPGKLTPHPMTHPLTSVHYTRHSSNRRKKH